MTISVKIPTIIGTIGVDTLIGTAGDDVISGLAGADRMSGGAGNDAYYVDNAADAVIENYSAGNDTVYASISYRLPTYVEHLLLTGTAHTSGYGNASNNTIIGNDGNNYLEGGGGNDTLLGGKGNDTYLATGATIAENANEGIDTVLYEGRSYYSLGANLENLTLGGIAGSQAWGNTQNNLLTGNSGDNTLLGKEGDDTLVGGGGDDTLDGGIGTDMAVFSGFFQNYKFTQIYGGWEIADTRAISIDGNDIIKNIEKIKFADRTIAIADLRPTPADTSASIPNLSVVSATGQEDQAIALTIAAQLTDKDGSETLSIQIAGVPASANLSAGTKNADGSWSLNASDLENLRLIPAADFSGQIALNVTAISREISNGTTATQTSSFTVNVAAVADAPTLTVKAASGNAGQSIPLEIAAALRDKDGSESLAILVEGLPTNINLNHGVKQANGSWLLNTADLDGLEAIGSFQTTGQFNLTITATATERENGVFARTSIVSNLEIKAPLWAGPTPTIYGTSGADILAGTAGNDVIAGLGAADRMSGGTGNDVYYVDNTADMIVENYNAGTDTIYSSVSYQLSNYTEHLVLTGAANINGLGSASNNIITGNDGNNYLEGGGGNDTLMGGKGDDTYLATGAVIVESANQGIDTVFYDGGSYFTLGANLENMILRGAAASQAWGNSENNILTGNSGNNVLLGKDGNDTLIGGGGNDTVDGGNGIDVAAFGGRSADYQLTQISGGWQVTGTAVGDGIDLLKNIEKIQFIDKTIDLANGGSNPNPTPNPTPTPGVLHAPDVPQAAGANEVVGFVLQNNGDSLQKSAVVSFGQVFAEGDIKPGGGLVALINGIAYPVQMDVKATHDDGSVRHAILSLKAPEIAAHNELDGVLTKVTSASTAPALTAQSALSAGLNLTIDVAVLQANGSKVPYHVDAAEVLQKAMASGAVQTWMSGSVASEFRVEHEIVKGLSAVFDIRVQADGNLHTDVIVRNDSAFTPGVTTFTYDVAIREGGQTVYAKDALFHYQNSTWHQEVWAHEAPNTNVARDVDYLIKTGATPAWDTSQGVTEQSILSDLTRLAGANTGPLGNALITQYLPQTGGRPDLGPVPEWYARYVLTQDQRAAKVMLENADAAGAIPWHYRDEITGEAVRIDQHTNLWLDYRGQVGTNGLPEAFSLANTGWTLDNAHKPDLAYLPYLFTGSHYYLDEMLAQAAYGVASINPAYRSGGQGILQPEHDQLRAVAWTLRDLTNAAYIAPDNHEMKDYFESLIDRNLANLKKIYVTDGKLDAAGTLEGWMEGVYGNPNNLAPWQQDFLAVTLQQAAVRGHGDAESLLHWMENYEAGRFIQGISGFNPFHGADYNLPFADSNGNLLSSWQALATAAAAGDPNWYNTAALAGYPDLSNGYAAYARGALAGLISTTGSIDAVEAYGFVQSQTQGAAASFQGNPLWNITPTLSNGRQLQAQDIHIASGSTPVTLTGAAGHDQLLHGGQGNDSIIGNNGIDLLLGGAGNDTLIGGVGNDYLIGGAGNDLLIGGSGNDQLKGGAGTDIFRIAEATSGHDIIADFQAGIDRVQLNAQGLGLTAAQTAALVQGITSDGHGNAILHLNQTNDLTVLGVSIDQLQHSIIIT